ncbi:MAG: cellulase family glycosylhydrolase [Acidimicrobiia bacterium]|nr:cellulase family glycosylhydrolase [Acidimicrobiia bacterium]
MVGGQGRVRNTGELGAGRRCPRRVVITLVVAVVALVAAACEPAPPQQQTIVAPLATDGARIVDANGDTVVLRGVNWFGFETEINVVHGLWVRDYRSMLEQIAGLGYDTIRLPWSVQSLRDNSISGVNFGLGANAELQGLTPLEAMDRVIDAAAENGLMILLDSHRLNNQRIPELWYGDGYTEADWIDTWVLLAERYKDRPNVIGADLKNEPHGPATWGTGDLATDWRLAAERAGNAVLAVAPHWLIVVEGIGGNVEGQQLPSHWWGGNLEAAGAHPVRLDVPNRLVYSPHEYGPGVFNQPWFSEPDLPDVLRHRWDVGFGYLVHEDIAPVLVGEFGGRQVGLDTVEGLWQQLFVNYLRDHQMSFTYWSWNPNSTDTGGILTDDWTTIHEDKQQMLNRLLVRGSPTPESSTTTASTTTTSTTVAAPTTTTTAPPASGLTFAVNVTDDWGSGYCAGISVTNGDPTPVSVPSLQFELVGASVTDHWNGTLTVNGSTHQVALPTWAHVVAAGSTMSAFGFCAARAGGTAGAFPTDIGG